jgi:hypothetical protein
MLIDAQTAKNVQKFAQWDWMLTAWFCREEWKIPIVYSVEVAWMPAQSRRFAFHSIPAQNPNKHTLN